MLNVSFTYGDLEFFLLILVRITCFIYIAPFFGMSNTPNMVKIGLGFCISVLLYGVLPKAVLDYDTVLEYAIIVMKEAATGLMIGFGATLCSTIVSFAGHIVDMEVGLSMATVMDPTTKENTSITGIYYNYMVLLMLIATGMHRWLLQALVDTFTLIPVNEAIFSTDKIFTAITEFMADYIIIGFRIALPVFCSILILNCVLGILAKVSPQLNMFAVGLQIKLLTGLMVLFLTAGMLPSAANFIFEQMKVMTTNFVNALM